MNDTFFSILCEANESYSDVSYYYDNRVREFDPISCTVQRTVRGCGFIEFEGQRYDVKVGQAMLFILGEDSKYGYSGKDGGVYELEYLALGGSLLRPVFERIRERLGPVFSLPDGSVVEAYFQETRRSCRSGGMKDRFHESHLVYKFLMMLLQYGDDEASRMEPAGRAREYMLNHYQTPITQGDVSDHLGMSREHLARIYAQRFKVSPGRYCTALRMARAKVLLRIASQSIEQVSLNCGYTDTSSFGRAFKAAHGLSPSAFRLSQMRSAR